MAEATVVGRTRVSLTPDTSNFGNLLRVELPKAIRPGAILAGDLAGTIITGKIDSAVRKMKPVVKVRVDLDTTAAKTRLGELGKNRTVKLTADLDDKAAVAGLTRLTADRTVKITAQLDDKAATAAVTKLTADRTLKVTVDLDEAGAKQRLQGILGNRTVDILPKIQQAAYNTAKKQLDRLTADRVVNIRASVDTRVAANEIRNLIQRRTVRIGADVDTRVAADDLANLTRRRMVTIQARADTAAATAALRTLTRDRTANVRIRSTGLAALTASLGALGGSGGGGGGGILALTGRIGALGAAALSTLPAIVSLGSAVAQLGPLAATAAPALGLLLGGFAAIKVGTTGIGDAIKAAFQPAASEAKAAATATKGVENAQRSLATAQRGVTDAERNLAAAQRAARQVQAELNDARRQAVRDLQDMNAQLKQGYLDQKQAALDVEQAELDLATTRSDPAATQLQIRQADLALERARAAAEEQGRQQKRLAADTKAAEKAGVEGSDVVVQAKERIRQANEQVAEQERNLADAHRAVAEAARQVADSHQNVATQTSKVDDALSKLSPNARQFVGILQQMAPAWRSMRLDVQDSLFAGLGTRLQAVGGQILPTVRTGLVGAAGEINTMGKNALTAVSNLEKTGQLGKVFDGIRQNLGNLNRIPGQLVTGFAQLSIAAQPAFNRITAGAGEAMDRVMAKLAKGLENGKLEEAINTALDVAVAFGKVLADIGGIFAGIFKAAGAAGGDFFGVIGSAIAEIRRVIELPEMQSALTAIFTALNAVAGLLAGALGAALQAILPVLAALAPSITMIAEMLAPVIADLMNVFGKALMPIAEALGPVLVVAAKAVVDLVTAFSPLLPVIGELVAALLPALVPLFEAVSQIAIALTPVIGILANLLGVTLRPVIEALVGVVAEIAMAFADQFMVILQQLMPVIPLLIPVVVQLADSIAEILIAVTPLIPQIMLLAVMLISQLLPAFLPLVGPLTQLTLLFTDFATYVIVGLVVPALQALVDFIGLMREKFQPGIDAVKWLTEGVANLFRKLYDILLGHSIIPDIVNGTIGLFTRLWRRISEIVTGLKDSIVRLFRSAKDGAVRIWDSFWDRVRSIASGAWRAVREGFSAFGDRLKDAFRGVRDSIGAIWKGIQNLVKNPIKFWIETVYNRGIVSVWNKTAAKIPGVPDMKTMSLPKGFARGGILPGFSTFRQGDDQLVPMRRGEGVYVSEAMRDPYERARLHAVNQAAMQGRSLAKFRGFAEGGIFGGLSDIGSGIKNGVGKALGKGADVVRGGLADLAESAFKPVKSGIKKAFGTNKGTYRGMIGAAPLGLIDKAIDYIRGKDIPEGTGQWLKPVNAPYGTRFGVRGLMWSSGRHTGLDFPAKTGTKIRAVDNGTVSSVQSGGPYGKHVTISHGGGLASLYAHMSSMVARAGEGIRRGARVGSVGATGNVTGPHLHLEARLNGRSVDPMPYLTGGDVGGSGVKRWTGVVQQALGQLNQSMSLVSTTLRRMNQESGGNPTAVNRWDSNWKAGHPSVGLMQVIRGTFAAYAGKYKKTGPFMYGVSTNPMANIYASMRYALSRYGSLSKAYNRPGGYALGGIVGGLRINRGLPSGGYASGGIIKVGGKRIDTGPLAASVGGSFLKQLAGTASEIDKAMTKVATAIKNAFKGVKTTLDNKLLAEVSKQNKALQALAKQRDQIKADIAAAKTFATEATQTAQQFTSLTGLPNGGNTFDVTGIQAGLNVRLGQLKKFGANLQILNQRGLSKALMQQIIAAGPDGGAAYAQALVDATPAQLKDINATQTAISKATSQFGLDAADAMFDAGANSGKGYLTGLASTQKAIEAQMAKIAKAIQKTIKVELKIKSPSQILRALGRFTGLGFSRGVEDTVPRARTAAVRMAGAVRTAASATTARIQTQQTIRNGGDRHLHYQATVSEVASRKSVLDALAIDDLLNRTVVA